MPSIKVDVEFQYPNSGVIVVPANDIITIEYYAPEGWTLMSWGVAAKVPELNVKDAFISADGDPVGVSRFLGTMQNTDSVSHGFRWTYVLMKN